MRRLCTIFLPSLIACLMLTALPKPAQAACHVVTPSGSGALTGADWNNAYAGLPATLTRGDTYYLADGTYGGYAFNTPLSGTQLITIKKAIASDNCTATGWNTGTMGSGQATFTGGGGAGCGNFYIATGSNTGYLTIDGQIGTGETKGSYGIYMPLSFVQSQCTNGPYNIITGTYTNTATHVTVRYVEIAGSCGGLAEDSTYRANCNAITNTPKSDSNFYLRGTDNLLVEHCFIHNSAGTPFTVVSGNSALTFQYNYVHLNNYTSTQHSNISDLHGGGNSNIIFANNSFHDVEGSGGITSLNAGSAGTDSGVKVYGNTFWYTSGNPFSRGGFGDGVVACINGNNCPSWLIYQNTIASITSGPSNGVEWLNSATGSPAPIVENNLWFNTVAPSFALPGGSTEDYNSFVQSGTGNGSGAHDVHDNAGPNPFVSSTNFHLAAENADWTGGVTLSSPYNIDPAGVTRGADGTWDRGAYEFNSGATALGPNPPQNLQAISVQ